jgi:hypothetical protein
MVGRWLSYDEEGYMCLDIVDEVFRESGDEVLRGYKVFVLREGVVEFQYHLWNGEREVPTRRWIDAEQVHLVSACGTEYISGFHIFKDMGDACGWMVVGLDTYVVAEVAYRGVVASGIQTPDLSVVVARSMVILDFRGFDFPGLVLKGG